MLGEMVLREWQAFPHVRESNLSLGYFAGPQRVGNFEIIDKGGAMVMRGKWWAR